MNIRNLSPAEIERGSFAVIAAELGDRIPDPELTPMDGTRGGDRPTGEKE